MENFHPIKAIVRQQKKGIAQGIYSACTANRYVIEACMEKALFSGSDVLIEATANQVNQLGGYTGMKPADFYSFVNEIAHSLNFPFDSLILGGDHLGPLIWKNEPSDLAIEKAKKLVRDYVFSGYTKIHIDTSMPLGDDLGRIATNVIAERGAILCKAAEEAFIERKNLFSNSVHPVYVIGSEVPIPGGSKDKEDNLRVTQTEDFHNTVKEFHEAFIKQGIENAWEQVVAVVVQPGVEFGDDNIHEYNRMEAQALSCALKEYPNIVFEGHSTDYQDLEKLKQMVEDGIAILKVGPALTFALREALFALCHIETELLSDKYGVQLSFFIETLEKAMLKYPENWNKHYRGESWKLKIARRYSFSDRARYYLSLPEVCTSIDLLLQNLKTIEIPLTLISQFMPIQYKKIRKGMLKNDPELLLKDRVRDCIDDYLHAVTP